MSQESIKPWFVGAAVFVAGSILYWLWSPAKAPSPVQTAIHAMVGANTVLNVDSGIVTQVCRDGTLVIRMPDNSYAVVRPHRDAGWKAEGSKLCAAE